MSTSRRNLIRQAIEAELARRKRAGERPANLYQLAQAVGLPPRAIYAKFRGHFGIDFADACLRALALVVVRKP